MKQFSFIILTILLSCNSNQDTKKHIDETDTTEIGKHKISSVNSQNADASETEIIETFVDSLNIGNKGKCKIELISHRVYDDYFIIIKFYIKGRNTSKSPETWMLQNYYSYEIYGGIVPELDPNILDFNNDNLNDITFVSGTAVRSANEVRRLLIYDKQKQELISIVNSESYPNMLYNKEMDCIDAFLVHGGCETIFLKIVGDSLKKFASVELHDGLIVSTYDKYGKEKIILTDKTYNPGYIRYKNFNPLKEYDDY